MSNYFNSLSEKDKLNQLGKCRFMKSEEFSDGVNILIDKKCKEKTSTSYIKNGKRVCVKMPEWYNQ